MVVGMLTVEAISTMTTEDKLRAMEDLWTSLAEDEASFSPPEWHREALQETEAKVRSGTEQFIDWTEAKASLRRRAK